MPPQFRPETRTAIAAVEAALRLAQNDAQAAKVTSKAGRDVVTTADVAAEDAIRATLTAAHGLPVIGEERGGEAPADGSPYWLVDPICGTRNYASGTTLWCVNLALVEGGAVTAGVVGDPSTGEVLVAERGSGAWALKHGAPRRLATAADSRTIVVEEGKSSGAVREHAARFMAEAVRADRWDFRSLGTTLSLAYLAAGRISGYVVLYVTPVHVAAGTLLVTEAGGLITDIEGAVWGLGSDTLIAAADPAVAADLLRIADATAPDGK
jgi:myo-inositol-1(or 4)-monophosphatase